MDTIKIHDLYEHCERISETLERCLEQAWANKRNQSPDIAAIAYFMQKVDLYRFEIPQMIRDFVDTQSEMDVETVPNCTQLYRNASPGEALDAWLAGKEVQFRMTFAPDEWGTIKEGCPGWDQSDYVFRIKND